MKTLISRFSGWLMTALALVLLAPSVTLATDYEDLQTIPRDYPGMFQYDIDFSDADSALTTDAYFSKWFYTGAGNDSYGWITVRSASDSTQDINVLIQFANETSGGFTSAVLDSATALYIDSLTTTTEVQDTVGIRNGTASIKYGKYAWARIKVVPGANLYNLDFSAEVTFRKSSGLADQSVARVKNAN